MGPCGWPSDSSPGYLVLSCPCLWRDGSCHLQVEEEACVSQDHPHSATSMAEPSAKECAHPACGPVIADPPTHPKGSPSRGLNAWSHYFMSEQLLRRWSKWWIPSLQPAWCLCPEAAGSNSELLKAPTAMCQTKICVVTSGPKLGFVLCQGSQGLSKAWVCICEGIDLFKSAFKCPTFTWLVNFQFVLQ